MNNSTRTSIIRVVIVAALAFTIYACAGSAAETETPTPGSADQPTAVGSTTQAATATGAMTETSTPTEEVTPTEAMTEAAGSDSVVASDQTLGTDNTVVIDKVVVAADGWLVIHADAAGKPGPVLGYVAVKKGENDNVKVPLKDTTGLTATVWAMLHVDAGTVGMYEFPGADIPLMDAAGNTVMAQFKLTM